MHCKCDFKNCSLWAGGECCSTNTIPCTSIPEQFLDGINIVIDCIGIDYKIHVCQPHLNVCECGVKVKRKKITLQDWDKYFSCYECSY